MAEGDVGGTPREVDREQDSDAMIDADSGSGAGYGNNADAPAGDEAPQDGEEDADKPS